MASKSDLLKVLDSIDAGYRAWWTTRQRAREDAARKLRDAAADRLRRAVLADMQRLAAKRGLTCRLDGDRHPVIIFDEHRGGYDAPFRATGQDQPEIARLDAALTHAGRKRAEADQAARVVLRELRTRVMLDGATPAVVAAVRAFAGRAGAVDGE